jgi:sugar phosphate isomerase/epimerase
VTIGNIVKYNFPFRLGTTSYIIPAEILPNVRYLADKVDDIELVLFESDDISNIPDDETVKQLQILANEHKLTYTIHLPLDAYLGSSEESVRQASVTKCLKIIERMDAVDPFSYVVHFHGDKRGNPPSDKINCWLNQHHKSMNDLLKYVSPRILAVETLDYPYELIETIVWEYDLATCLDIGHILICNHPLDKYINKYLPRTSVIHLHGVCGNKDHANISHIEGKLLSKLITTFCTSADEMNRVLTLEIFNKEDFLTSLDVLRIYQG